MSLSSKLKASSRPLRKLNLLIVARNLVILALRLPAHLVLLILAHPGHYPHIRSKPIPKSTKRRKNHFTASLEVVGSGFLITGLCPSSSTSTLHIFAKLSHRPLVKSYTTGIDSAYQKIEGLEEAWRVFNECRELGTLKVI